MISLFFERLEKNKAEIDKTGCLPKALIGLISVEDLKRCYQFVIGRRPLLTEHFNDAVLEDAQSYRLDKKHTQLPRTLNIIFDIEKSDFYLILETKRKKEELNGQVVKELSMKTFSGASKTTKPAWRIDGESPEKWANAVFYVSKSNPASEQALLTRALVEARFAQSFVQEKQKPPVLNCPSLGAVIPKSGLRVNNQKKVLYARKISFYSKWADGGDLEDFLKSPKGKMLTREQRDKIAIQLLQAVKIMHDAHAIHQDIKLKNILVFSDGLDYRVELADFGFSLKKSVVNFNHQLGALATLQYESPEIALCYQNPYSVCHDYFYKKGVPSYGRDLASPQFATKPEYRVPHPANDMFALGIVLYQLYHQGKFPDAKKVIEPDWVLSGLLSIKREDRWTADQALKSISDEKEPEEPEEPEVQSKKRKVLPTDGCFNRVIKRMRS